MKQALLSLICLAGGLCFSGCAGYDQSYSLNVSSGKQSVGFGVTLHPRTLPPTQGLAK